MDWLELITVIRWPIVTLIIFLTLYQMSRDDD